MNSTRSVGIVLSLSVALISCAGGSTNDSQIGMEAVLQASFRRAAMDAPFAYRVRQAEFQNDSTSDAWVVRIDDPVPAAVELRDTPDVADLLIYWPMEFYANAIGSHLEELDFVDVYLLSFADDCETVYEIMPSTLGDLIKGTLDVVEAADQVKMTTMTGC